jgi:hypothetical protein
VKTLSLVFLLAGCEQLIGLHDTKVEPDAPAADAAPDAPPPKIDVGDGHDGPLTVTGTTTTDDARTALTADVGANSTLLHVADASPFQIGDEIVIFQMTGSAAGQHETHRIASTQPSQLLLADALANSYGGDGKVQVIRVPHFTDVMITTGTLTAHPWDGTTGGVVFFRASGTVTVGAMGALTADLIGFAGGTGGTTGTAGVHGTGGGGGGVASCPLGCSTNPFAPSGGNGQVNGGGMPGQPAAVTSTCHSGKGGDGAAMGEIGTVNLGTPGEGLMMSAVSTGGMNLSPNAEHPVLGAGGGGGDGGAGGHGAGGGGGGGGPLSGGSLTQQPTAGSPGTDGGDGGTGGAGGNGGTGGGIIIVAANALALEGTVSANGAIGTAGIDGTDAGNGGNGGDGGVAAANCNGAFLHGGRGAGGTGGDGGGAGGGGGGGGAGVIELDAFTIAASGTASALGGPGAAAGVPGHGGSGGDGFGGSAPGGADGAAASAGTAGGNGFVFLRYVDGCTSCNAFGMPTAVVTQL